MIYELAKELAAALIVQGCPFPVVYGPERTSQVASRNRIVLERAPRESFDKPTANHPNPRMSHTRRLDCVFRVFAQSSYPGASQHDHERLADQIVDMVVAELDILAKLRKNTWAMGSGGFVDSADAAGSMTLAGVVYEGHFGIDRGVFRKTWQGEARPTVTLHKAYATNVTLTFAGTSIIRASGLWATDGFAIGDSMAVTGSVSNNISTTIATVLGDTLTVAASLTTEGPTPGCTVTGPRGLGIDATVTLDNVTFEDV